MIPVTDYTYISPLSSLTTHTRFTLTLRTLDEPTEYRRLLLFRLSPVSYKPTHGAKEEQDEEDVKLYCMESTCPHMGAPLAHAPITMNKSENDTTDSEGKEQDDDQETHNLSQGLKETSLNPSNRSTEEEIDQALNISLAPELSSSSFSPPEIEDLGGTITCPWHQYDFDLETGEGSMGIDVCVYDVRVTKGEVWVKTPSREEEGEGRWEVLEVKGVSEEFLEGAKCGNVQANPSGSSTSAQNPIVNPSNLPPLPRTLVQSALLILQTPNPTQKVALTRQTTTSLRTGSFLSILPSKKDLSLAQALFRPAEGKGWRTERGAMGEQKRGFVPPREGLREVDPGMVGKRGKGGSEKSRILMIHALANIEQWAIDLAWDIITRFAHFEINGSKLPIEFYLDWAKVAEDEAKHFTLLSNRLTELRSYYGAHTVHAGLWESALDTQDDLLARLAIVCLVHEARGLDVNPVTIKKFEKAGDIKSRDMMEIIHLDEITHVTTGHRWFTWICSRAGIDPVATFRRLVKENFAGKIKGPFSVDDRGQAGMDGDWYEGLEGYKASAYGSKVEGDERVHPRLT